MKHTLVVQLVDTWRPQNISIVLYLVQNIWTIHDVVGVATNLQMWKSSRSTILTHVSFLFVCLLGPKKDSHVNNINYFYHSIKCSKISAHFMHNILIWFFYQFLIGFDEL
jgi:hypothetical protein